MIKEKLLNRLSLMIFNFALFDLGCSEKIHSKALNTLRWWKKTKYADLTSKPQLMTP